MKKKNTAGGIYITKINNILFDFSKNFWYNIYRKLRKEKKKKGGK